MFSRLVMILLLATASSAHAYLTQPPPPPASNTEVWLAAKASHGTILRSGEEDFYILVTTKTAKNKSTKKLPLNIAIVIDRSGSMADRGKLDYARQAAGEFIKKLDNEDRVSLVDYDEQITVLAEPTLVGTDRGVLLKKINLLEPRGSTNLAGGMVEGGKQVEKFLDDNRINRVLLLSDGLANTGVVQIPEVSALAENLSRKGIQVTTFGLGADFDEEMMTRIADAAGGNYYFIESGGQIAGIFEKERRALVSVVGKKARLVIEPAREIEFLDAFGYRTRKSGNKIIVDMPDLFSGQNRKILLRFKPKVREARELVVATVTLEYADAAKNRERRELREAITAKTTNDRTVFEKSADPEVMVESAKIASSRQIEEAMKTYAGGNISEANNFLTQAKSILQNAYQSNPSPALMQQMNEIEQTLDKIRNTSADSEGGRLLIKEEKYKARQQQQGL